MNGAILFRIDDRLIHGQVTVGWLSRFPIKHLIVGNNQYAAAEWEKSLLMMAAPEGLHTAILSLDELLQYCRDYQGANQSCMVLLKAVDDLGSLSDKGLAPQSINLGGMHFENDRRPVLPYLFFSDREKSVLKRLMKKGFVFECQDLPDSPKVDLAKIIDR